MNLPLTVAEITSDWLTGVLRERYPGVTVRDITIVETLHGTASKIRLRATYQTANRSAELPMALVVKGGFSAHRELMYREYMLEARFYAGLAPRLRSVRVPNCHYAGWNDPQRQAIVVLDDLLDCNATFCRVERTLNFAQAAAQLELLAALHAQWWQSPQLSSSEELKWIEPLDPLPEGVLGTYQRGQLRPEVYAYCMNLPRGRAVAHRFHDRDRMEGAMEQLRRVDRMGPHCVLHADAHLGNWYHQADQSPGLLDWQSVRTGPWAHDFNYFVVSALDMLDRREWERPLLQHYLAALSVQGLTPPAFEDAFVAYRAQSVYGLYYWLVNPVEFQVEENNCAVAPRFAFAAIDHGTFELLDQLAPL